MSAIKVIPTEYTYFDVTWINSYRSRYSIYVKISLFVGQVHTTCQAHSLTVSAKQLQAK